MIAAAAFTACASDEMGGNNSAPKSDVISLTSSMAQTRATSNLQTNALNTATKVGVFGISGTAAVTNGNNNPYSVSGTGDLTADTKDMKWPSDESATVDIYAYAPYQSSWTAYDAAADFAVASDQSSDAGYLASDLIYAQATPTDQNTVNLAFAHKLSRIVLTLRTDESTSLSDATVKIVGTKPSTTFTLTSDYKSDGAGSIGTATGTASDIIIGSGISLGANSSTMFYGVIVPQTISANTTLIEVTGGGKRWRYHFSSDATFVGGKSHSASITVSSNSFTSTIGDNATEPAN